MKNMKKLILTLAGLIIINSVYAETIPQKPDRYFNDYAGIVASEKAAQFNERLAQFERDTSNQFVVAIYPYMDTDSDPADYTQRIAQSWGVGQKDKNNGVILFVFMKTSSGHGHMRVVTGYGLEGAIPDALAKETTSQMVPYFKNKEYDNGLEIGIASVISAAKGEYKGTGTTVAEQPIQISATAVWFVVSIIILGIIIGGICLIIHFRHERMERELREKEEESERRNTLDDLRRNRISNLHQFKTKKKPTTSYVPLPIPIPIPESEDRPKKRRDDDDYRSSSSSSSSDSSGGGFSDFSSGGGSFGGGGAGSDF